MSEIAEKILKFCLVHLSKRLQTSLSIATEMTLQKTLLQPIFFLRIAHIFLFISFNRTRKWSLK